MNYENEWAEKEKCMVFMNKVILRKNEITNKGVFEQIYCIFLYTIQAGLLILSF